jgi:hypothetical protein
MMSDYDEDPRVRRAAKVHIALEDTASIPVAMKYAGFTTPEQQNRSLQQRVRRYEQKVNKDAGVIPVPQVKDPSASLGSLSTITRYNKIPPRLKDPPPSTPMLPQSIADQLYSIADQLKGSKRSLDLTEMLAGNPAEVVKKTRRTKAQKQSDDAMEALRAQKETEGMKLATRLLSESRKLPKGDPNKKSTQEIVNSCNKRFGSTLNRQTLERYVRNDLIGVPLLKRGPRTRECKDVSGGKESCNTTALRE